jgi:hypothetical protein
VKEIVVVGINKGGKVNDDSTSVRRLKFATDRHCIAY